MYVSEQFSLLCHILLNVLYGLLYVQGVYDGRKQSVQARRPLTLHNIHPASDKTFPFLLLCWSLSLFISHALFFSLIYVNQVG